MKNPHPNDPHLLWLMKKLNLKLNMFVICLPFVIIMGGFL